MPPSLSGFCQASLCLWFFLKFEYDTPRLYIFLLVILIGDLWNSWNCSFVSVFILENSEPLLLQMFLLFFLLLVSNHICATRVVNAPQSYNSWNPFCYLIFLWHVSIEVSSYALLVSSFSSLQVSTSKAYFEKKAIFMSSIPFDS